MLDRAAEYVRLADQGLSAAQIARRRRKSPAHVSILLRLGRALAGVPEAEWAALRSPRVTWRLVQRLVRTDVDPASLRKQLRDAVGGFSTHNRDGRQQRRRRTPEGLGQGAGVARGVAWGWDAAWFAEDPVGYAAAHLAHLTHVHRIVAKRAEHAVRTREAGTLAGIDAGQSLRGLQRRLRQVTTPTDGPRPTTAALPTNAEQQALEAFAILARALHTAGTAIAAVNGASDTASASGSDDASISNPGGHTASHALMPEPPPLPGRTATLDEIAADLDEP